MPSPRVLAGVALALVAGVSVLLVVLVLWERGSSGSGERATPTDPIAATGALTPRIVLFGDTITAQVDVTVDREIIDADDVDVTWSPAPWARIGQPRRSRQDSGGSAYLRTTFVLRCLERPCLPVRETEEVELRPAQVTYTAPVGEGTRRLSVDVEWPTVVVHTRAGATDDSRRDVLAAPWRAELVALPEATYRVAPSILVWLFAAGGIALVLLGGVLGYRALPERRPPPPAPEPVPEPTLSPLEQALELLERPAGVDGVPERDRKSVV